MKNGLKRTWMKVAWKWNSDDIKENLQNFEDSIKISCSRKLKKCNKLIKNLNLQICTAIGCISTPNIESGTFTVFLSTPTGTTRA